ncbi:F-box domain-containing protein [Mycena sanguinolenta]|uniref:F-box domain-containing protein n=1 Tax=Mycena sanguinolenta TaxID=230812 RepID=A0A8H7DDP2_9AGAR|nr:F-box domain-containing protein [Mycena sanguinolenta]
MSQTSPSRALPPKAPLVPPIKHNDDKAPISSHNHVSSNELMQRGLDEDIQKYQESIRSLQYQRNALSPIGRLPPEMLSRVFMFCIHRDSLSWIREVSHICRHWRAVALGCPNLWSFPVFSQPRWADEMLKRSKMAPLTVKADLTYMTPKMIESVHSSLAQISRIGEMDIRVGSRSVNEILNLTDAAPYLHTLCLMSPGFSHDDHFALGSTFLNGETPRLRRLELTRFFLPWDSPLLSNLVHLKIQNPGPAPARPSMADLIGALERMPRLESLELDRALPVIAADTSALSVPSSRAQLSHLKRIVIMNASVLECADVLNHLSFNGTSTPTIKISCAAENSTRADFSTLIPALSNVQTATATRHLRTLSIVLGFGGMMIRAWPCFVSSGLLPGQLPFLDLDCKWLRFLRDESEELLAFACKLMPLRGLRSLSISTDMHELETKTWISTFGHLPTLLSIRLRGQSGQLIAALGEDVVVDGVKQIPPPPTTRLPARRMNLRRPRMEDVSGGLFFPALRNLILEDTDFSDPAVDTLETALMERCERKQELWALTLSDCTHLASDDVTRLRNVVTDLQWDGLELGFSDDESDGDYSEFGDPYYPGFLYHTSDDELDSDYYDYTMSMF